MRMKSLKVAVKVGERVPILVTAVKHKAPLFGSEWFPIEGFVSDLAGNALISLLNTLSICFIYDSHVYCFFFFFFYVW